MVSKPHGQKLVNLKRKAVAPKELSQLRSLDLDQEQAVTITNIADGVFSPLEGPMGKEETESVVETMRLTNDLPWTIPILLQVTAKDSDGFGKGDLVSLKAEGHPFATLTVEEKFSFDKGNYVAKVFGTTDEKHPGVAKVLASGDVAVAGKVELLAKKAKEFDEYHLTPRETRVLFSEKGWRTVCAFQTRNAPHIGHEYLQKTALAFTDGVFVNPVIGKKKPGDFKDEVIIDSYRALVKHYYPKDSVVLSILRYEMQYAGPREAIMHAIMRKNFGCTHIAIGRDHAGVGNYYQPYAAQEIFKEFPDLGITPLFFKEFFYCTKCAGLANEKICPHPVEARLNFSGTKLRNLFESGQRPPKEFMREEVSDEILRHPHPFVE